MSVGTYAFSGGVDEVPAQGQKSNVIITGDWAAGDTWSMLVTASPGGNFTVGSGWWAGKTPTVCFTFKDRVYVGMGDQFNFSANGDPTRWEEQDAGDGAGYILYMSQIGGQDQVIGFSQLQGRLAVFARRSVQIWNVASNPDAFGLNQALENTGAIAPLPIQAIGDADVMYPADNGIRSLRTKEITQNASMDDVGSPVDALIKEELNHVGWTACGIVEPVDGNYWIFLNDDLYVFSNHPSSKVTAWSTYKTLDNFGASFTPHKFVSFNGIVYCRSQENGFYIYGGASGSLYDGCIVWGRTPWHENRKPSTLKQAVSIDTVMSGGWVVKGSMDPVSGVLSTLLTRGDNLIPDDTKDSTFGTGRIPFVSVGTHYSFEFKSNAECKVKQTFSAILFKDANLNLI